jgi:hypothetical protein
MGFPRLRPENGILYSSSGSDPLEYAHLSLLSDLMKVMKRRILFWMVMTRSHRAGPEGEGAEGDSAEGEGDSCSDRRERATSFAGKAFCEGATFWRMQASRRTSFYSRVGFERLRRCLYNSTTTDSGELFTFLLETPT